MFGSEVVSSENLFTPRPFYRKCTMLYYTIEFLNGIPNRISKFGIKRSKLISNLISKVSGLINESGKDEQLNILILCLKLEVFGLNFYFWSIFSDF